MGNPWFMAPCMLVPALGCASDPSDIPDGGTSSETTSTNTSTMATLTGSASSSSAPNTTTNSASDSASTSITDGSIGTSAADTTAGGDSGYGLDFEGLANLVGFWSFNSADIDGATVRDLSGAGHDGTAMGAVTFTAPGRFGEAAEFFGGDHIDVGMPAGLDFDHTIADSGYTISAWVKTESSGSIFGKRGASVQYQLFVFTDGLLGAHVGGEGQFFFAGAVADDAWHHVAMTVARSGDSTTVELFVDDAAAGAQVVSGATTNDDAVWIGMRPGGFAFTGLIDEIAVFDRALSAAEVAALYP